MSMATEMWVVYLMIGKKANGMKAVCLESEWNDLEVAKPGEQLLVKD